MQQNINPINFQARILLKKPNTNIKPNFMIGGSRGTSQMNNHSMPVKTKEPSWLQKLLFGIKKHTKMPSVK